MRVWARSVIKTRCAPEARADALAELDRTSSAELAGLIRRHLDEWQDPVHERFYLRALAADRGDTDMAELIDTCAKSSERPQLTSAILVHWLGERGNCLGCGEYWPCHALNEAFSAAYPADAR
ncbi:hypothetical protein GCM10023321_63910 [Pseudonocardia eucalypti]|uniref:Uncharacterized protein n=1 Tax=Pseudonocardia eucalypti TaxID=648755 RepID=A0ABP9QXP6_9PSEU